MRIIPRRQVNELNDAITITADDQNEANGNASHHYNIKLTLPNGGERNWVLDFQDGPIKEEGFNGLTSEVLMDILIDRMKSFQSSKFSCRENAIALTHLETAVLWMQERTRVRVSQNVEGTQATHK